MTTEEILAEKKIAEGEIMHILLNFQEKTGFAITSVSPDWIKGRDTAGKYMALSNVDSLIEM